MRANSGQVYETIRRKILSGQFRSGDRLREAALVAQLGVSRTPIREALRRLQSDGLVDFEPNKGARVTSWSPRDLLDAFSIRVQIEALAARLAAERISELQIAALERLAAGMEALLETESEAQEIQHGELNNEFHHTIIEAAASSGIEAIMSTVVAVPIVDGRDGATSVDLPLGQRTIQHYSQTELRRRASHHREIIAALKARDSEWAESIVRTHILSSRAAFRAHSQGLQDSTSAD